MNHERFLEDIQGNEGKGEEYEWEAQSELT